MKRLLTFCAFSDFRLALNRKDVVVFVDWPISRTARSGKSQVSSSSTSGSFRFFFETRPRSERKAQGRAPPRYALYVFKAVSGTASL